MTSRERTFIWDDPASWVAGVRGLSGLEILQGVISGRYPAPPMARLMEIRLTEVAKGRAVFEADPAEYHYNPMGVAHGGFAATILDSAMGCAIFTAIEIGDVYTTVELKLNYLRPLTMASGRVRAVGSVLHMGRTTALAEGRLEDASGALCAHATSTCLIKRS